MSERVIALANQKGGAGKTTSAVNLGAALAEAGRRVLLVDLDPQGDSTKWLGHQPDGTGLYELFQERAQLDQLAQPTAVPGLELLPASKALARADRDLAGLIGIDYRLRAALADAKPRDVALLDCPPNLGVLVAAALTAAGEAVVPVAAHVMELQGLADLLATISTVRRLTNPDLQLWVLACRVDGRTRLSAEVVAAIRTQFGDRALAGVIRENVRLAEAVAHQQPITVYDPHSTGAHDYRALASELDRKGRAQEASR